MNTVIETIYFLENPEKDLITFATGSQLRYEDIIKDVFGVACLKDLHMMIQYNKGFQESLCARYGVQENEITMELVVRVASQVEILQLRKQFVDKNNEDETAEFDNMPCPFDSIIKLREGIFKWDQKNFSYCQV